MGFDNTGIIAGKDAQALLINPTSAYVVVGRCNYGCGDAFFCGGVLWSDSIEDACIFRSYEAASAGMGAAREATKGCLKEKGATMDIKPLAGYLS